MRAQLRAKIVEIDQRIDAMVAARARLGHALTCERPSFLECPTFRAGLRGLLTASLESTGDGAEPAGS